MRKRKSNSGIICTSTELLVDWLVAFTRRLVLKRVMEAATLYATEDEAVSGTLFYSDTKGSLDQDKLPSEGADAFLARILWPFVSRVVMEPCPEDVLESVIATTKRKVDRKGRYADTMPKGTCGVMFDT